MSINMPAWLRLGIKDFPKSESYYEMCLSLPMYPSLSDVDLQFVIDKVLEYVSKS